MKSLTIATVGVMSAVALVGCSGAGGGDGTFPKKEITWIVPYGAGGNTDAISRSVAKAMSENLKQDIIVENAPGGSGAVGTQKIQGSKPDGYTIGLFTTGTMTVTPLLNDLGYSYEDFTNIGLMLTQPVVLLADPSSEYQSAEELIEAAKSSPGKLSVGVPGATTPQAYELNRMREEFGVDFTVVPFDSNAEVMNALRGGNIQAAALNASSDVRKSVESSEVKPLAIGEAERADWISDTPTLKELGFESLVNSGTLIGATAPDNLPDDVKKKLEDSLEEALTDEPVIDLLGADNIGSEFIGSEKVTEELKQSKEVYEKLVSN